MLKHEVQMLYLNEYEIGISSSHVLANELQCIVK